MIQKEQASRKQMETRALNVYQSGPLLEHAEDSEEDETSVRTGEIEYEQGDRLFMTRVCKGDRSGRLLQEIPQLIIVNEILLQPTSRRFLRELDEASGENNLHYILQCLRIPALVTRV